MKNPCKLCIVKPSCSKDCNAFDKYIEGWCVVSVLIGSILIIPVLFYLIYFQNFIPIFLVWGITAGLNLIFNFFIMKYSELDNELFFIIFAPWVSLTILVTLLISSISLRDIRKRQV